MKIRKSTRISDSVYSFYSWFYLDLIEYMDGLNYENPLALKSWAMKMFDATGKLPPPGALEGNKYLTWNIEPKYEHTQTW